MQSPLHFVLLTLAGWVKRHQGDVIEYLKEENRVLRQQLGGRRTVALLEQRVELDHQRVRGRWRGDASSPLGNAAFHIPRAFGPDRCEIRTEPLGFFGRNFAARRRRNRCGQKRKQEKG